MQRLTCWLSEVVSGCGVGNVGDNVCDGVTMLDPAVFGVGVVFAG